MPLKGSDNRSAGKLIKAYTQRDIGPSGLQGDSPREAGPTPSGIGPTGMEATGGTTTTYTDPTGNWKSHTFTSTGTFVVTKAPGGTPADCEFWLQGGGGGTKTNPMGTGPGPGGGNREAGSGAGGALYGPAGPLGTSTYPVTIGAGGNTGEGGDSTFATPSPGTGPYTALGVGAGGAGDPPPANQGNNGGCGGGGWYTGGNPGNAGEGNQPQPHPSITALATDGYPGSSSPEYGGAGGGTADAGGRGDDKGEGTSNNYRYGPAVAQVYGVGGEESDYPSTDRRAAGAINTGNGSSGTMQGGSGILVIRYQI